MDPYKIFKLRSGAINLNDAIAEAIITYCLGIMENTEFDFTKWKIGISDAHQKFGEELGKEWECTNELIAIDTKRYFVEEKIMNDDNGKKKVRGRIIYVKR